MNTNPLHSAGLKAKRAKRHICDLNTEISAFLHRDPYVVRVEPFHKPGSYALRYVERENIPETFPLIIGDAVHNLRTALDHLAVALVRLAGKSTKNVYFPFADSAQNLEGAIASRKIARAGPKVVDEIRLLQPYKGGNLVLRGIHDLDIADKHAMLTPTCRLVEPPGGIITNAEGGLQIASSDIVMDAEDGDLLDVVPIEPNLQIGKEFPLPAEIVFDETVRTFAGGLVTEVLEEASMQIDSVLNTFSAMIRRREIP